MSDRAYLIDRSERLLGTVTIDGPYPGVILYKGDAFVRETAASYYYRLAVSLYVNHTDETRPYHR